MKQKNWLIENLEVYERKILRLKLDIEDILEDIKMMKYIHYDEKNKKDIPTHKAIEMSKYVVGIRKKEK